MKILIFLLSTGVFAACSTAEQPVSKAIVMEQKDIIKLVKNDNIEAVKQALENGADVNTTDNNQRNLLLLATMGRQVEMARLLVANKADVNMQADNQDSPFLYAGASG